jgi:hypothetical protein
MTLRRVTWSALTFLSILVVACGGSIDASPGDDAAGSGTGGTKADGGTTGTGGGGVTTTGSGASGSGGASGGTTTGVTIGGGGSLVTSGGGGSAGTGGAAGGGGTVVIVDSGADRSAPRDAAPDGGRIPVNHRATGETCDQVRSSSTLFPPEDAGAPIAACHTDANCTAGANGRCRSTRFSWVCTYDTCFTDADCTVTSDAGEVKRMCFCGGDAPNTCKGGDCQTDSDCSGSFCSPTLGSCGNYLGTVEYHCHTPQDECTNDSDCAGYDSGISSFGLPPYCAFASEVGHWKCSSSQCAG